MQYHHKRFFNKTQGNITEGRNKEITNLKYHLVKAEYKTTDYSKPFSAHLQSLFWEFDSGFSWQSIAFPSRTPKHFSVVLSKYGEMALLPRLHSLQLLPKEVKISFGVKNPFRSHIFPKSCRNLNFILRKHAKQKMCLASKPYLLSTNSETGHANFPANSFSTFFDFVSTADMWFEAEILIQIAV